MNEIVTGVDDTSSVGEGDSATLFPSVLANDSYPDGLGSVVLVSGPAEGALVFNPDGTYSFDPQNDFDDLAEGATRDVQFVYRVTDIDGDFDEATVTITVTGANDAPVVTSNAGDASGSVDEAGNNDNGSVNVGDPTDSGTLKSSDVDTGATATWSGSAAGTYGSFAIQTDGNWTYTLDNSNPLTEQLAEGQVVYDTFTATVTDEFGGTATETVTITVKGRNDAADITSDPSEAEGDVVEEGNLHDGTPDPGTPSATGTLTTSDVDTGASGTWSGDDTGTYGSFAIDPATGVWTYTLNNADNDTQDLYEGQVVTEVFTVRFTDDKGARTEQTVTVTVTGTNDTPVVTSDAQDAEGLIIEAGNKDDGGTIGGDPTENGTLKFSDVDDILGANATWSIAPEAGNATALGTMVIDPVTGNWTYTLDQGAADYLGETQSVIETFTATITDEFGGYATETVTITITGTNDSPVITSGAGEAEGMVIEAGNLSDGTTTPGTPSTSGTLTFDEVDDVVMDSATWTIVADNNDTELGVMQIDPETGKWFYTLDQNAAEYLNDGEQVIETFTATVTDEFGASATQTVTVIIEGGNDSVPLNSVDHAPPPRLDTAEWLEYEINNLEINQDNVAEIDVNAIATNPNGAQDIIVTDKGSKPIDEIIVKNLGGNDNDVVRFDLTGFNDDFVLTVNGEGPGDLIVFTGVDSVVYNADFTQTLTYTGSDGQEHVVTVSNTIPFDQVLHYTVADNIVEATAADETIDDGFTDYAGDQVDATADNVIHGHGGADTITGGTGADTIFGDFDKPSGFIAGDLSYPDPNAEILSFEITNGEINNGDVHIHLDEIANDTGGREDITITDVGTESITFMHISKLGSADGQQDVVRIDLSTFDDDFTIDLDDESFEDYIVFTHADSVVDNGDGTSTVNYTGTDGNPHTVTLDTGLAQLVHFPEAISHKFDDVIDAGAGSDFVDGGYGADSIQGGTGSDTLIGNIGGDTIEGGDGADVIYGDFAETPEPLPAPEVLPWAEKLYVNVGDDDIDDVDGTVEINVGDLTDEPNMSQDVTITDFSTEDITEVKITNLGGDQVDVIRLDLSLFDDDFDFIAENVDSGDSVIFTGVDSVVDNGDGTQTLTYTGSDDQIHTVLVDTNNAQLQVVLTTVDTAPFETDGDTIDGGLGDDTIDGGFGDDSITGGEGADVIVASAGNDTIDGGSGQDTYDSTGSPTLASGPITVSTDASGVGTVVKAADGSTDTVSGVETFIAGEGADDDTIEVTADVLGNQILGLDGDEAGVFTSDRGDVIPFGGPGEPTLSQILTGTYTPPGRPYPINPSGDYQVFGDDLEFKVGDVAFDGFEQVNFGVNDPMVVCFVRGTRILTDAGEVRVEDLSGGGRILTLDDGYQPIKWIGRSLAFAKDNLAPVVIRKGAIGNTRDLVVSQQHRIFISGGQAELLFGESEMLAPAKSLVNHSNVFIRPGGLVEYFHVFFERHQIIYSEGALTESLYPGEQGLSALCDEARKDLLDTHPGLATDPDAYGETARPCLTAREASLLADNLSSLSQRFVLSPSTELKVNDSETIKAAECAA